MVQLTSITINNRKGLRICTFDNIKRKNTLSQQTFNEVIKALKDAEEDDTVRVVAFTGAGNFYSSGNDMAAMQESAGTVDEKLMLSRNVLSELVRSMAAFPKPLVAVVNGPAIGIAATTAALCDVIYVEENAYFHTPFTALGLCPEGTSSYLFPRILGRSKANEMLLFNHKLTAQEALQFNFVSHIFKFDEIESIWNRLEQYADLPKESTAVSKGLIKRHELNHLYFANIIENDALSKRYVSQEMLEAFMKFLTRKSKL